jgi:hypothetical protein
MRTVVVVVVPKQNYQAMFPMKFAMGMLMGQWLVLAFGHHSWAVDPEVDGLAAHGGISLHLLLFPFASLTFSRT